MGTYKPELKTECIRLRTEEQKSFREIALLTGASKGSLSGWLQNYPLPDEKRKQLLARTPTYHTPKKNRGEESVIHQLSKTRNLDPNQRSKVAEIAVALRMAAMGFEVFGAVGDGPKADWLVLVPSTGKVWKIQVKLTRPSKEGLPLIVLRCSQNSRVYENKEVDFFVGYDLFTDTAYVWAWSEVEHLSASVSITPEAAERWDKLEV